MKERFRRIPIELTLAPKYEERTADAKLVYLTLIISARQTPPGIYDGGMKSLAYETALQNDRLKSALKELEQATLIEEISSGGWWVKDTFRVQCCNADYAKAAIRHLTEKWPRILPKFLETNKSILEKFGAKGKQKDPPQTGDSPPSHPPQSPTGSEAGAVTGTDTGSGSDSGAGAAPKPPPATGSGTGSGGRGYQGEGGVAAALAGALRAPRAASPPGEGEKGNGKDVDKGIPVVVTGILETIPSEKRGQVTNLWQAVQAGDISIQSARKTLLSGDYLPEVLIDRLFQVRKGPEDWLDG